MPKVKYKVADRKIFSEKVNRFLDNICVLKPRRTASDCIEQCRYIETKYGVDYEVRSVSAEATSLNLMGAFTGTREDYARIINDGITCNPFTGKWNFHFFNEDVDVAFYHITKWLTIIRREEDETTY